MTFSYSNIDRNCFQYIVSFGSELPKEMLQNFINSGEEPREIFLDKKKAFSDIIREIENGSSGLQNRITVYKVADYSLKVIAIAGGITLLCLIFAQSDEKKQEEYASKVATLIISALSVFGSALASKWQAANEKKRASNEAIHAALSGVLSYLGLPVRPFAVEEENVEHKGLLKRICCCFSRVENNEAQKEEV